MKKQIVLKKGREKSLLRRHPWIFSGAVAKIEGMLVPGETVEIVSSDDKWLARAAYSPLSQITGRVWTFDQKEDIDEDFFSKRISQAIAYRKFLKLDKPDAAYRLIASESDGLSGLIVDKYADFLVVQFLSCAVENYKKIIVAQLAEMTSCKGIYERSDVGARKKEGLKETAGWLWGEEPPALIEINEDGLKFKVDVRHGHKTGFYLDQRNNRIMLKELTENKTVLNCFAFTGSFGVAAAAGGATMVTNIDSAAQAMELAAENMKINNIANDRFENITGDVFKMLRKFREEKRKFDIVVLDPPKFIESQKDLQRACRGYKDIAMIAFQILNPGGLLLTFSCSGLMPVDLFQKITADAALDAEVQGKIVRQFSQSADHPVSFSFPEAGYLKGLLCRVDN